MGLIIKKNIEKPESTINIHFDFPLMGLDKKHYVDLSVYATSFVTSKNEVAVRIDTISFFEPGKFMSSNVEKLLEITSPETYQDILAACVAVAEDKFNVIT